MPLAFCSLPRPATPAYLRVVLGFVLALVAGVPLLHAQGTGVFGQATQSQAAMMGILYDLKQTQDRAPTGVTPDSYSQVMDEYFSHGWDEHLLDHYYRATRPLFTTQIFVPMFDADEAPREFGVEGLVKPSRWIVHYKAQVSAPAAGTYRFLGFCDDLMVAAVNGKTVLNGSLGDTRLPGLNWTPTERSGPSTGDGRRMTFGTWFTVGATEIVDLDVVIGERPGGYFGAFLLIQQQGATYPHGGDGYPILPIFQVAAHDTPHAGTEPEFTQGAAPWKSYQ